MSYVTTIGATTAVRLPSAISPAQVAALSQSTTKRPTLSPTTAARPSTATPVVFTGAGIAEAPNHTALIAGGAVAVGLLVVLALRR